MDFIGYENQNKLKDEDNQKEEDFEITKSIQIQLALACLSLAQLCPSLSSYFFKLFS